MAHKELKISYINPCILTNSDRQLRILPKTQISKAKHLLSYCGLVIPVIIDKNNKTITGLYFVIAAKELGLKEIPVLRLDHLDDTQIRILRIAHDRILEEGEWDKEALAAEFQDLQMLLPDLDLTITGFDIEEIDLTLDLLPDIDPDDDIPEKMSGPPVVKLGDHWMLGKHNLVCGDSLEKASFDLLMGDDRATACFTDMPYNVKINGHVGNSGKIKHSEFIQASGEMTEDEFTTFLTKAHQNIANYTKDGAVIYSCMDWRHLPEILSATRACGLSMMNLCVWVKDNGGMGSFYRSRHELVLMLKNGTAKHINNVCLGIHGRYRTNVWEYPGVNAFGNGRMDELKMHPTVKPTAMVTDAIKDCTRRDDIVLDPFGGSGTTLIAADKTGRRARLIELDPLYCDVTIRRWQVSTGLDAVHIKSQKTFNEIEKLGGQNNDEG